MQTVAQPTSLPFLHHYLGQASNLSFRINLAVPYVMIQEGGCEGQGEVQVMHEMYNFKTKIQGKTSIGYRSKT